MPEISVVMSVYKESLDSFKMAVNSILCQDYEDFDFIIINDNPNEEKYRKYIAELSNKKIRYFDNQSNIGLARCMNKAAALSKAKYLARMDADDCSEPNRLSIEYETALRKGADVVYSPCIIMDAEGNEIRKTPYYNENYIYKKLPIENPIIHPSVLLNRERFIRLGGYNNYITSQDYDLWLRMLANGYNFSGVKECLIRKTDHRESVSSDKAYLQLVTGQYISYQYVKFLKSKKYFFSEEDYKKFLVRRDAFNKEKSIKADSDIHILFEIKEDNNSKTVDYLKLYLSSPMLIRNGLYKRMIMLLVKAYSNNR